MLHNRIKLSDYIGLYIVTQEHCLKQGIVASYAAHSFSPNVTTPTFGCIIGKMKCKNYTNGNSNIALCWLLPVLLADVILRNKSY